MAKDGKGWLGMAGDGQGWLGMARDEDGLKIEITPNMKISRKFQTKPKKEGDSKK